MINYTVEGDSIFHRMDPRIKLYWSIVISILIMILDNSFILGMILLTTILPWFFIPLKMFHSYKKLVIVIVIVILGKSLSQSLFYNLEPRTSLLTLVPSNFPILGYITGGIHVYYEGFIYGAKTSLRFLCCLFLGLFLIKTTHFSSIILAMQKLRVPCNITFGFSIAFRFLPIMFSEFNRILLAQRLRGFTANGVLKKFESLKIAFVPLIMGLVKRSNQLTIAAEARAFSDKRTFLKDLKMSKTDIIFLIILSLYLAAGIIAYFLGYGSLINIR